MKKSVGRKDKQMDRRVDDKLSVTGGRGWIDEQNVRFS